MIHGFGASGSVFYKMVKHLMSEFRVTTIDLLGMGCSGRPPFALDTAAESIDYFLLSIEAWMQTAAYKTEEYVLLGHSLGGYLSANFAIRYPQKLAKLLLVSAVGIQPKPETFSVENIAQKQSATRAFMIRRAGGMWESHYSPFSVLRGMGWYAANKLLTGYVNRRLLLDSEQEKEAFKNLLVQITMRDKSSEVAITTILEFGAWARHPMRDRIKEISVPICFLYGDVDWMNRSVADGCVERGEVLPGSFVATVEQAGHHLYVDNALGVVGNILKFVFNEAKQSEFLSETNYREKIEKRVPDPNVVHPGMGEV